MLLGPKTGLLTPLSGGRPRGARIRETGKGKIRIELASAPLRAGVWYSDTLEELLDRDPEAESRAKGLTRAGGRWRFEPAKERWTFARPCLDRLTGLTLQHHDPAPPPTPQYAPELYEGERGDRLLRTIRLAPAAWCRQCRKWIDQDTGEEF